MRSAKPATPAVPAGLRGHHHHCHHQHHHMGVIPGRALGPRARPCRRSLDQRDMPWVCSLFLQPLRALKNVTSLSWIRVLDLVIRQSAFLYAFPPFRPRFGGTEGTDSAVDCRTTIRTDTAIPKVRLFSLGGGPPPHCWGGTRTALTFVFLRTLYSNWAGDPSTGIKS